MERIRREDETLKRKDVERRPTANEGSGDDESEIDISDKSQWEAARKTKLGDVGVVEKAGRDKGKEKEVEGGGTEKVAGQAGREDGRMEQQGDGREKSMEQLEQEAIAREKRRARFEAASPPNPPSIKSPEEKQAEKQARRVRPCPPPSSLLPPSTLFNMKRLT